MMLWLSELCRQISETALSTNLRESIYTYPLVETAHVLGLALLVGTILVVDLRLVGVLFRHESPATILRWLLPYTWAGFVVMSVSGILLFIAEATKMIVNPAFQLKFALLVLVGLNALIFHRTVGRNVSAWSVGTVLPVQARTAGYVSMTIWASLVAVGRAIAYFH